MRIPVGILGVALLGISGCLTMFTDPMDRRGVFEETQMRFAQYVRWGKFEEASQFVDPAMREEFMSFAPELSDLRFSDYEVTRIDMDDGLRSASVDVRYTGYRLSAPYERSVILTEEWTRDASTDLWTVKVDIKTLHDTLIGVP